MKTINQYINKLNQKDWNYNFINYDTILENPFNGKISHSNFIKNYFKYSGKKEVMNSFPILNNEIKYSIHSNSIFFLGILLFNNTNIKKNYFTKINKAGYHEFPFIWFLTCLFHDFGKHLEKDKDLLKKISDIDMLINKFNIEYCLLDKNVPNIHIILFNNIRQYFKYRRVIHKKIDHGIVAGIYLFDRLIKNRIKKEKEKTDNYKWHKELENQYALASSAIATHNIWLPKDKTVSNYLKFEMNSLINFDPISLNNFPLLFLLGIIDTIDPIKLFIQNFPEKYILNNLLIEFNNNKIIIQNKANSKLDFDVLLNKCDNFKGWLNVTTIKKKNQLTIEMK